MLGVDGKAGRSGLADTVFVDIKVQDDAALGGDLRRDLEFEVGLAKSDGGRATGRCHLVGQLGALLDQGLDLVGSHHPRARHHLALAIGLQRRELEVQEAVGGHTENRHSKGRRTVAALTERWQVDKIAAQVNRAPGAAARHRIAITAAKGQPAVTAQGETGLAAACRAQITATQTHAQRFTKSIRSFDDARLNQHLAHRDVKLGDQLLHLLEPGGHIGHKQLVGAGFPNGTAARAEQA